MAHSRAPRGQIRRDADAGPRRLGYGSSSSLAGGMSVPARRWYSSRTRVLQTTMTFDQVDVTNLAAAELVAGVLQKEKHKFKLAAADDAGETSLFTGASGSWSIISPKLTEWIGSEMQKEAERRKAREERTLARKNDKPEKNEKKGDR